MSHSQIGCWKEVDSWLLVVGSQTASLTPGPSFVHNLGCRCPNDQCEAIFDIYVSRPFQWHQEHLNVRCFGVFWALLSSSKHSRVPEDSKSPTFPSVGLHPHTWPKWGCDIRSMEKITKNKPKRIIHWFLAKKNGLRWTLFDTEWRNVTHLVERKANWCITSCWFIVAILFILFMIVWNAFLPPYIIEFILHFNYRIIMTR
jgi:hypothetical protein